MKKLLTLILSVALASGAFGQKIQDLPQKTTLGLTDRLLLYDATAATSKTVTLSNLAVSLPTLNQNTTGSAATLTTPRAINGTNFDGSAAITVTAAAGTLTGATLNSGVTASSLTSVGALTGGSASTGFTIAFGSVTMTGAVPVANGGTNIASYAIGDLLYASGSTTLSKLADVATGNALISGGVTTAPSWGKITTSHTTGIAASGSNGDITALTAVSGAFVFTGTGGGSYIELPSQSSAPSAANSGTIRLYENGGSLRSKDSSSVVLNYSTLESAQTITGIKTFTPAARSSGSAAYLTITMPADTGISTTAESIGVNFTAATRTWVDGTTTLQREHVFGAPTYNKTTTSAVFTTAINLDVADPIAGTGVTFTNKYALRAASFDVTGNANLEGTTTATTVNATTVNATSIAYAATLSVDDTYAGEIITGLNNSGGVTQWDVVYLNSSSQWVKADANGASTYPAVGIATATVSTGNATTVLIRGVFRDDGGTSWTVGSNVYLSTTAGAMTSTAPSTTGDKVQVIGTALAAHTIYVHPSSDYGTAP